jgi:N-acetylneuraminate lyase
MKIKGLIAAVATPMYADGEVNLDAIGSYAEFLIRRGVSGVFVCGTSGEGLLMTSDERKKLAEKWMEYSDRLKILVHVGSTSYKIASELAAHAESIGADAISAMGPCFLQPSRAEELVAFNKIIAGKAPNTPYYYYHIPGTSGVHVNMTEFIKLAAKEIPNFNGIKFTDFNTFQMQECINYQGKKYDILHGHDETLVSGLLIGATGAIGTSYNVASPMFLKLMDTFNSGNVEKAVSLQAKANTLVSLMCKPSNCIVGVKAMLEVMGIPAGPCRLPQRNLSKEEIKRFEAEFKSIENIIE